MKNNNLAPQKKSILLVFFLLLIFLIVYFLFYSGFSFNENRSILGQNFKKNSSKNNILFSGSLDDFYKAYDKSFVSLFKNALTLDEKSTMRAFNDFKKGIITEDFFRTSLVYLTKEKSFSKEIIQYIDNLSKRGEKIQDRAGDYIFGIILAEAGILPNDCGNFLSIFSGSVYYSSNYDVCTDQTFFNQFIKNPSGNLYKEAKIQGYIKTNDQFYQNTLQFLSSDNFTCGDPKKEIFCTILLKKKSFEELKKQSGSDSQKKSDIFNITDFGVVPFFQDVSSMDSDQLTRLFYDNIYFYRVKMEHSSLLCANIENQILSDHCSETFSKTEKIKEKYLILAQEYRQYRYLYGY